MKCLSYLSLLIVLLIVIPWLSPAHSNLQYAELDHKYLLVLAALILGGYSLYRKGKDEWITCARYGHGLRRLLPCFGCALSLRHGNVRRGLRVGRERLWDFERSENRSCAFCVEANKITIIMWFLGEEAPFGAFFIVQNIAHESGKTPIYSRYTHGTKKALTNFTS